MKLAFSYQRFSKAEQSKGDSIRRQSAFRDEWLANNPDYQLADLILQDHGISAFKGRNAKSGDLARFLDLCEQGKIPKGAVLLVENLDRLSRQKPWRTMGLLMSITEYGVRIVTKDITLSEDSDQNDAIRVIMDADRSNRESECKSDRCGKAWRNKQKNAAEKKMTKIGPYWLKLSFNRKTWIPIPEKVATIKKIFALAIDGMGAGAIAVKFNQEGVPGIGRCKTWHKSYILRLLGNRSLLGEYQPHSVQGATQRRPVGELIPNYYPAIVKEADFWKVQQSLADRKIQRGRNGKNIVNLFTGIAFDARDNATLAIVASGGQWGHSFVSSAAQRGRKGSIYRTFCYEAFEEAFLGCTNELTAADILPATKPKDDVSEQLAVEEGKQAKIKRQIDTAKKRRNLEGNFDSLLDLLFDLENDLKVTEKKIGSLKQQQHQVGEDTLVETKELIELLKTTKGDELTELRLRLKARIKSLVKEIRVMFLPPNGVNRRMYAEISYLPAGKRGLWVYTYCGKLSAWFAHETRRSEFSIGLRDKTVRNQLDQLEFSATVGFAPGNLQAEIHPAANPHAFASRLSTLQTALLGIQPKRIRKRKNISA